MGAATSTRFTKYASTVDTASESSASQHADYTRIEQEISAINQALARVNSLNSADTVAKEIKPRVKYLDEEFDNDEARKSLSKEQYNRVVRKVHETYARIMALAEVERSFYGSVHLAKVGNTFKYIVRDVTHPKKG